MVKVISLSNEAYNKLRAIKGNRSFSELVINIMEKKNKKTLMDFYGIWADKKEEVEKMKKMIEDDRKKFKLRDFKW